MKKKLLLGLFTVSTLLFLNNVYAYECQYSEGVFLVVRNMEKLRFLLGR